VIKHISVGNEAISLHTLDLDSEDATRHHHADLRVLLQRELTIVWYLIADSIIILLDVPDLLANLVLERATFEPGSLLLRVKDGEVVEGLRQNIYVLIVPGRLLPALLHDVGGQERVLRGDKSLAETPGEHLSSNWRLLGHFQRDDLILGHV